MIDADDIRRRIEASGWAVVPLASGAGLRTLISIFGLDDTAAKICVERISPKRPEDARPRTMSALYGLGPFPLHTERAHWRHPPRYVIFRSVGAATERPTTLADSYGLDSSVVRRLFETQWCVEWAGTFFHTPVLTRTGGGWQVRYDRCCMTTTDARLQNDLDEALQHIPIQEHHWKRDLALLIDNWRILHGRGPATAADYDRVLERIVIA